MDFNELESAVTLMNIGWMATTFISERPELMAEFEQWVLSHEKISVEEIEEGTIAGDVKVAAQNFHSSGQRLQRIYHAAILAAATGKIAYVSADEFPPPDMN